jgi:hypothetical protein
MLAMMRIWRAATRSEQEAFWRVTVKNSRDPGDLQACDPMIRALSLHCGNESN